MAMTFPNGATGIATEYFYDMPHFHVEFAPLGWGIGFNQAKWAAKTGKMGGD